jgi:hypothetical protein
MSAKRTKRPKLERDRPRREWSTLFGGAGAAKENAGARAAGPRAPSNGNVLSDTVELGYRVIEDYLKQGQQVAQTFAPGRGPAGRGAPGMPPFAPPSSPEEMQQMAQRLMQYGWDFAGLWFEMFSRMGGSGMWPTAAGAGAHPMPGAGGIGGFGGNGSSGANGASHAAEEPAVDVPTPASLMVSIDSPLRATTSVELQPGVLGELKVHALRPEGHDAPPIKSVSVEREDDGELSIQVKVEATQPPGMYRAAIIDAATNQTRGRLSLRLEAKKR